MTAGPPGRASTPRHANLRNGRQALGPAGDETPRATDAAYAPVLPAAEAVAKTSCAEKHPTYLIKINRRPIV